MGINKFRFTDNIEIAISKFFCGICDDVVNDPILTNGCQHYLCRDCVTADIKLCPTCGVNINGYDEIDVALRRIYSSIKLKCVYKKCKEVLTIDSYAEHERKCPEGFYECSNLCGFKIRLSLDDDLRVHNCIEVLQGRIAAMEATNAELWSMNEALGVRNTDLEKENQRLLAVIEQNTKRRGKY